MNDEEENGNGDWGKCKDGESPMINQMKERLSNYWWSVPFAVVFDFSAKSQVWVIRRQ